LAVPNHGFLDTWGSGTRFSRVQKAIGEHGTGSMSVLGAFFQKNDNFWKLASAITQ